MRQRECVCPSTQTPRLLQYFCKSGAAAGMHSAEVPSPLSHHTHPPHHPPQRRTIDEGDPEGGLEVGQVGGVVDAELDLDGLATVDDLLGCVAVAQGKASQGAADTGRAPDNGPLTAGLPAGQQCQGAGLAGCRRGRNTSLLGSSRARCCAGCAVATQPAHAPGSPSGLKLHCAGPVLLATPGPLGPSVTAVRKGMLRRLRTKCCAPNWPAPLEAVQIPTRRRGCAPTRCSLHPEQPVPVGGGVGAVVARVHCDARSPLPFGGDVVIRGGHDVRLKGGREGHRKQHRCHQGQREPLGARHGGCASQPPADNHLLQAPCPSTRSKRPSGWLPCPIQQKQAAGVWLRRQLMTQIKSSVRRLLRTAGRR